MQCMMEGNHLHVILYAEMMTVNNLLFYSNV